MDLKEISEKVQQVEVKPLGVVEEYAVLIPLIEINGELEILYEMRSKNMKRQPGEISFPGGRVELGETYREAAIRETMEELNIARENIEVFGETEHLVSITGDRIHCFVGVIKGIDIEDISPNLAEVDHVFTVPLKFFLEEEPDIYQVDFVRKNGEDFPYDLIPGGKNYAWSNFKDDVYFYRYDDYVIWGFTAKMTNNFIKIIK